MQVVHLHESNSVDVVYTADNGSVVDRWQVCNDRRFALRSWRVTAVLNVIDLINSDNPANYRRLPIVIGTDYCSTPIMQLQCRISQCIGNPILREFGANGTNDHSLWSCTLDNEPTNHHVITRLNKAAGADVTQSWRTCLSLS